MTAGPQIAVVTHFASPYQVDLFDQVEQLRPGALAVYYLHRTHPTRNWSAKAPKHPAWFFADGPSVLAQATRDFESVPLAVFNYYAEPPVPALIEARVSSGKLWSFWGERPGYQYPILGRFVRRWKLRRLHASQQPIWGVGQWAVEAYQDEFGSNRSYVNLPYFSDLAPYASVPTAPAPGALTFLYSGSLSPRKGVDLLARAFSRLAKTAPAARLKIMGSGHLQSTMQSTLAACAAQVEWIGFKDWHELGAVYASAHVLCVPSRYDGWGLVVPEGLAAGLPVIATDRTGSAHDLIAPGVNGWITPAGDEDGLYECLHRAAALDGRAWQTMSLAARAAVDTHTLMHGARRFLAAADAALSKAAA